MEDYWKIVRCVVANIRREVLVLVNFQDKYYSVSYQIYIIVSIPRVAIWNVTAKQVILISSDFLRCSGRDIYGDILN